MQSITKRRFVTMAGATGITLAAGVPAAQAQNKKLLAFVVNVAADFWTFAKRGTEKAQRELANYQIEFIIPPEATAAGQKRVLEDLLARNVAGVSISPVNPDDSTDILNQIAAKGVLFTQDSDAPKSNRAMYIGTDNVAGGREVGNLMKKAAPKGGKAMLFVGTMDAANARERVQGVRESLAGSGIEIIDVRTDNVDFARAKANVEDTLTKYPDIAVLTGLWAYNTPQIYNAVKAAGKEGKVKIVGFDEDQQTLRGISEGVIEGTVVQQPYEFGYQSMKLMARWIEGDKSFIPANKLNIVPTKIIDKSNVTEFTNTIRALLRG